MDGTGGEDFFADVAGFSVDPTKLNNLIRRKVRQNNRGRPDPKILKQRSLLHLLPIRHYLLSFYVAGRKSVPDVRNTVGKSAVLAVNALMSFDKVELAKLRLHLSGHFDPNLRKLILLKVRVYAHLAEILLVSGTLDG